MSRPNVLEATGVSVSLGGMPVLTELSLAVEEGAVFGLIGGNGSGKTTLFNVIAGEIQAYAGAIVVGGCNIDGLSVTARAQAGIGRVFQESRLFPPLTVADHFHLVGADRPRHKAPDTLRAAELVELRNDLLPVLPASIKLLDRRRIELALALLRRPLLLLTDEIGAGLSEDEGARLYSYLLAAVDNRLVGAIISIEHKLQLLSSFATEIGLLNGGAIRKRARPGRDDLRALTNVLFLERDPL